MVQITKKDLDRYIELIEKAKEKLTSEAVEYYLDYHTDNVAEFDIHDWLNDEQKRELKRLEKLLKIQ